MRDEKWHGLTQWQAKQYRLGKACDLCKEANRLYHREMRVKRELRAMLDA